MASYYSVKQLDLLDADSLTQWINVFELNTDGPFSSMYIAPDGKIYIGTIGNSISSLSVISNPNAKVIASQVCYNCLQFPTLGVTGPPCMPNYQLGASPNPCWPLGTEDIKEIEHLEVYPNPSQNVIYIKGKSYFGLKKELFSAVRILTLITTKNEIEVSHLPSGVYFLKCKGKVVRVVVN